MLVGIVTGRVALSPPRFPDLPRRGPLVSRARPGPASLLVLPAPARLPRPRALSALPARHSPGTLAGLAVRAAPRAVLRRGRALPVPPLAGALLIGGGLTAGP